MKEILMRISTLIVLACAFALPAFSGKIRAAELQSKPTVLEQCGAQSQAGMRECLEKESRASNAALRHAEEQAAAAISKWDEDARFINLAKKKLRASNKAYEQYRDAQCAFAYFLGGGAIGNALEMRRLTCRIELDIGRIKQLNTDMSTLSEK